MSASSRPAAVTTGSWRLGNHMPINVYEGDRPICQCHTAADAARIVAAVNAQIPPAPPMYPDTRFLTLCTLDRRRGGEVTVGESRVPVAGVLATIRAVGLAEAACMWPQLTEDELAVLERLVADVDERDSEDAEDGDDEPTAADPHRVELCWTPDQNFSRVSVYPSRSPVVAIVGQVRAGEPPDEVATDYGVTEAGVRILDRLAAELTEEVEDGLRFAGDLIHTAVTNACPDVLTDEACAQTADDALAYLSAIPGVTVVRGPDSAPWQPSQAVVPSAETVLELPGWVRHIVGSATTELTETALEVLRLRTEVETLTASARNLHERTGRAEAEADRLRAELAVPCADGTHLLPHYDEQGRVHYLLAPS